MKRLPQMRRLLFAHLVACDLLMVIPSTLALYGSTRLDLSVSDVLGLSILLSTVATIWTPLQTHIQRGLGASNLQMLIAAVACACVSPIFGGSSVFFPALGIRNKGQWYVASLGFALARGPYQTYSASLVAELTPEGYESSLASLFLLSSRSTSFLGATLLAAIVQATGRFDVAWLSFALTTLITLPLFMSIDVGRGVIEAKDYARSQKVAYDDAA